MGRNDDIHIRVVDKRVSVAGIEYQLYPTDDWLRSAILRKSSPHLVELYSWICSLGGDPRRGLEELDGPNRVPSLLTPWSRRAPKQPSSSAAASLTSPRGGSGAGGSGIQGSSGSTAKATPRPVPANRKRTNTVDSETSEALVQGILTALAKEDLPAPIDQNGPSDSPTFLPEYPQSPLSPTPPLQEQQQQQQQQQTTIPAPVSKDLKVQDFDQNAIQHIATFFKEGLDATGITVFGDLLSPNRRPTTELISSFFYGVVLSPLLEPALIEAALHILYRTLQLHGTEPFTGLWDVSARRRELRDGSLPIISGFFDPKSAAVSNLLLSYPQHSGANSPATTSSSSAVSTGGGGGGSYAMSDDDDNDVPSRGKRAGMTAQGGSSSSNSGGVSVIPRRLPAWNDLWEMMRAQLRLDDRPENRRFFEFQEFRIKLVLQPNGEESSSEDEDDEDEEEAKEVEAYQGGDGVGGRLSKDRKRKRRQPRAATATALKRRPEREVRDELGRKIVGFLFDVLEQDIVQKNVSKWTFFYRKALVMDLQRSSAARHALDFIIQIVQTATIEPYLKRPARTKQQSLAFTTGAVANNTNNDSTHPQAGDADTAADTDADADADNDMDISFTGDISMTDATLPVMDSANEDEHVTSDRNHNSTHHPPPNHSDHNMHHPVRYPMQVWDQMGRGELTAAGQELLDLAHRLLSWLIQYAQSGMFGRELDSDWLAREVLQRIGKLQNLRDSEDRRNVGSGGGGAGGGGLGAGAGAGGTGGAGARGRGAGSNSADTTTTTTTGGETWVESSQSNMEERIAKCRMRIDQTEAFWRGLLYPNACSLSIVSARQKRATAVAAVNGSSDPSLPSSLLLLLPPPPLEPSPGLCTFTMIILDLQFRIHGSGASLSKARVPGSLPVFKDVVQYYAAPPHLPESFMSADDATTTAGTTNDKRAVQTRRKQGARGSKKAADAEAAAALAAKKASDKTTDEVLTTLENLEWHVMKIEMLIAAWIRSAGLRREDLAGTGLETHPLLAGGSGGGTQSWDAERAAASSATTGWMAMAQTLKAVGGSLWTRWQTLEQTIALAVLAEEMGLA
ncbi:hypothetical protein BGZ73_001005 [Actinomortierella ambigua]|nr:hypothetical protein BGZ73_001005 [Actinomortierella ambigua]